MALIRSVPPDIYTIRRNDMAEVNDFVFLRTGLSTVWESSLLLVVPQIVAGEI